MEAGKCVDIKKGSKRGGHFHKENQEAFYIVEGKLILILDENEEHEETEFSTGEMFMISPYQMHNFIFGRYNYGIYV